MPARKLGRIQSRGRNRRAGWIDSNSLGILKGYFTSVRATEHMTSCCIVASSAIAHWQSNPLDGRKSACRTDDFGPASYGITSLDSRFLECLAQPLQKGTPFSIGVMNSAGKFVMECVIETKGSMLLQLIDGLRGDVHITFDEGPGRLFLSDTRHDDTGRLVQLA